MKRLECLDGLRGVLAIYVMLGHLAPFALLPAWLQDSVSHGGAAVDVFFILSGMVITQSLYSAGGQAMPFLVSRAARIYPVFLPVFVLAVLIQPGSCGFDRMPWVGPENAARTICVMAWPHNWLIEIMAHLTMTHGLFPNGVLPDVWISFLGAAWSLSAEWQFYIFALVASSAGPRQLRNRLLLLALAGIAWRWSVPQDWQFSRAFLANKAEFFALGVASLGLVHRRRPGALALYCATLGVSLLICASQGSPAKMVPPLVWTVCLAAQIRPTTPCLLPISGLLRSRPARYLGAISYCIYLVNEPIHKVLAAGLSHLAQGDAALFTALWMPSAIMLPIVAADWLSRHVERPGIHWGRVATHAWLRQPIGIARS